MKKITTHLLLSFLTAVVLLSSCDKEDQPVIPIPGYDIESYGIPPTFENATEEMKIQRVFIEDFTGHQCGYCPEAAIVAENIKAANPGKISILAIHAGDLTDVSEDYPTDWTSETGDVLWATIPTGGQFNPGGRVNRAPNSDQLHLHTAWGDLTNTQLAMEPKAVIQLAHTLFEEDNVLNVHVFSEMLQNHDGSLRLALYLSESELVGDQLDYASNPSHIYDYEFEHVLRDGINGNVGVLLGENLLQGATIQLDYTYEYNPNWNINHCQVVAVIYDDATGNIINSMEMDI